MAFPTIPTGGRIVTANQENTTATRQTANLSGLTKSAGDLLIAIFYAYQASGTNATFSAWTSGWTELTDLGTSGSTVAIGVAYKWSTGSETGTVQATQAGTPTGFCSSVVMSIPGAHATTPPEASTLATDTSTAANPPSLAPSWGAADTLWVAANANGETSASGTWTANNGAPTNYTGYVGSNPTDSSTVGQVAGAVAFRQLNASSEDPGAFSQDTSNARSGAITIAVKPAPATQTGTATLALTAGRVAAGVASTINHPDLFPGTSFDSFWAPGTGWTVTGGRAVGDPSVAGSYLYPTNSGWSLVGNNVTFETEQYPTASDGSAGCYFSLYVDTNNFVSWSVLSQTTLKATKKVAGTTTDVYTTTLDARLHRYLRIREASGTTYWESSPDGTNWTTRHSVANPITLTKLQMEVGSVRGAGTAVLPWLVESFKAKRTSAAEVTLGAGSAPAARTGHSIKVRARTTTGSDGEFRAILLDGSTQRTPALLVGPLTNAPADYTLNIADADAAGISSYSTLSVRFWGESASALAFEVDQLRLETPPAAGATTVTGSATLALTAGRTAAGRSTLKASATLALTDSRVAAGRRGQLGGATLALTDTRAATGRPTYKGAATLALTDTGTAAGTKTRTGTASLALTDSRAASGRSTLKTSAAVALSYAALPSGQRKAFGQASLSLTDTGTAAGGRTVSGAASLSLSNARTAAGSASKSGSASLSLTSTRTAAGQRRALAQAALALADGRTAAGRSTLKAAASLALTDNRAAVGRTTYKSSASLALTDGRAAAGSRIGTGQASLALSNSRTALAVATYKALSSLALTDSRTAAGTRTRLGTAALSLTDGRTAAGQRKALGMAALLLTDSRTAAGRPTYKGSATRAVGATITAAPSGATVASATLSLTSSRTATAKRTALALASLSLTDARTAAGSRQRLGTASLALSDARTAAGRRTARSSALLALANARTASAAGGAQGSASLSLTAGGLAAGFPTHKGSASLALADGRLAAGRLGSKGAAQLALTDARAALGRRTALAQAQTGLSYLGLAQGAPTRLGGASLDLAALLVARYSQNVLGSADLGLGALVSVLGYVPSTPWSHDGWLADGYRNPRVGLAQPGHRPGVVDPDDEPWPPGAAPPGIPPPHGTNPPFVESGWLSGAETPKRRS